MDALALYLKSLNGIEPLDKEEEYKLAHRIAQGDDEALSKLVTHNLKFCIFVLKATSMWKHSHVPMEELIAIANEQLVIAAKKWKPTNGSSFATFAKQIIIRGTRRALDNTSLGIRLPVNVAEKIKKYHYTVRSLSQILGRKPTNLEICTIMGTTEDKLAMLQTYLNREPVSLDAINEERMEEENHD